MNLYALNTLQVSWLIKGDDLKFQDGCQNQRWWSLIVYFEQFLHNIKPFINCHN